MIRNKFVRLAAGALLVTGLLGVGRQASAYTQGACRADGEKLCPGLTGKELTPCLKQHQDQLSEPCKVNLAEARQVVRDLYASCQPDIEKYCPDVPVGGGRIRRCLKAHEANLTADCKAEIASARERYKTILPTPSTATAPAAPPAK